MYISSSRDEPTYGNYDDKFSVLNTLSRFETEITKDGSLEVGVIFHEHNYLEEVFIKRCKYVEYWGIDKGKFDKVMHEFGLYRIDDLNYIDEYPLVTEWLQKFEPDALETSEVIIELNKVFKSGE